ncbi:exodeoxyribonuclease VII small subunit [Candidatus Acidulodesulfobacterium sp. H_13]|uniref:exodeoxyribonuclease VII small subunit n=1 Tax=Candidatus Acidulodesulfobacterium sp. H_13 TaxID=3395470 RepID=UPI003AF6AF9E
MNTEDRDTGKNINVLTFEEALKKLEENVLSLEKGDLGLEDSIRIYEEGIKYSDYLIKKLNSAEKKVEELTAKNNDGIQASLSTEQLNL